MKKISIKDIWNNKIKINSLITIKGWIKSKRNSKLGFSFLSVYDGSHINNIQIIAKKKISNYNDILNLTTGCSVEIKGKLILSIGKKQKYEINANTIKIIGWVYKKESYPISLKKHSNSFLRSVAHLRPRTNLISVISRIRHFLSYEIHSYLNDNGYYLINTPLITTLNTEGSGDLFYINTKKDNKNNFFQKKAFLTVSGQLHLETYACALSKVYTFGPTFRAENSNTRKHLSEFWMLELEKSFSNLKNINIISEKLIKHLFKKVIEKCDSDINFLSNNINCNIVKKLKKDINSEFIKINYSEAIEILYKKNKLFNRKIFWGSEIYKEHEIYLTNNYFNCPIIINNYPKKIKAFYMRLNDDNKTVAAMDILFPNVGEIIGGSQREERLNILDLKLKEMNFKKKDYWWYRDLRKYGTVPHSGFGLGFERLISYITGIKNIKDLIPFPRTPKSAYF
ncbi:Asparagine--tRNA ligase [Candidatus Annandia adelgestsuga]|uniref:Asparagine--tRNA ligase n=1 Tax=Candidatus Annandia adelgestsuga TaxID=1302411 RepID=A0A3S9J7E1_9ENTR|nr:asparagine--tRNA ligase [Candidatus Annandia adelgestsuga]AZP36167.1 Asparagine--tRNA ligase [Candidatus Annandia adelgestsuga]